MIWKRLDGQLTQASPCCSSCFPVPSSGQVLSGRVIPMYLRNAVLSLESWTHSTCSAISGRSHKCRVKTGWIWAHIGSSAALRSWLFRCLSAPLHFPVFSKCFTVDTCYFFKGKSNHDKAKGFPMTGYWALSLLFQSDSAPWPTPDVQPSCDHRQCTLKGCYLIWPRTVGDLSTSGREPGKTQAMTSGPWVLHWDLSLFLFAAIFKSGRIISKAQGRELLFQWRFDCDFCSGGQTWLKRCKSVWSPKN